ncbi:MAG: hypothetical protein QOJ59_5174 [Thermomicrobiales bacterium]|jgi:hypothetical protein|nr:hypothetical protein [Thermomicrobiales bacterium]
MVILSAAKDPSPITARADEATTYVRGTSE